MLARELDRDPDLLLVGQPTRGVDIGAIEFIHRRLVALRDAGRRCCWSRSSWTRSSRWPIAILVMHDGRIVGDVPQAEATESSIGRMMAGLTP